MRVAGYDSLFSGDRAALRSTEPLHYGFRRSLDGLDTAGYAIIRGPPWHKPSCEVLQLTA